MATLLWSLLSTSEQPVEDNFSCSSKYSNGTGIILNHEAGMSSRILKGLWKNGDAGVSVSS